MDYGTEYGDSKQDEIEARLREIYGAAQAELKKSLQDFTSRKAAVDQIKRKQVESGEISEADYKEWLAGQAFIGKQWQAKVNHACKVMSEARARATQIINHEQMDVFAENANYQAYKLEHDANLSYGFGIYDADTVETLIRDQPELLPRRIVNKQTGQRADAWNQRTISNAITQGIIQGDDIETIANRIATRTAHNNYKAVVRYARTAMTGAQNAGRMETLHRAQGMGIKVRKKWLATLDSRTRDSHQYLDGQVQDIDKPFESLLGEIMFPGDLSAEDGDIWNCRCTLEYVYPDFTDLEKNVQRYDQEEGTPIADMTYDQWKAAKHPDWRARKPKAKPQKAKPQVTNQQEPSGTVISKYQPDSYDEGFKGFDAEWAQITSSFTARRNKLVGDYQTADRTERVRINQELLDLGEKKSKALQALKDKYSIESTAKGLQDNGIEFVPVTKLDKPRSEDEIIGMLCGGDRTKGSCASLAFAYAGQKGGYDILDFRDGESRSAFSRGCEPILRGLKQDGLPVQVGTAKTYNTAGKRLLANVEEGKEYYFACARHAAIVRRTGGNLQYLELQSGVSNGWKSFNKYGDVGKTLSGRFGAPKSGYGYEVEAFMVDVESLAKSKRLAKVFGFINTRPGEQHKGAGGYER